MSKSEIKSALAQDIRNAAISGFEPKFGQLGQTFAGNDRWAAMKDLGTQLWLDTGSLDESERLWTREFSALTTNNTLLNKEVQTGIYDSLIVTAGEIVSSHQQVSPELIRLEIAFLLNAHHALKLVQRFDAYVSVELHTDLAHNVKATVEYARRYYEICPDRFIIKVPLTPAGLLATRQISREGIPVNHTLGFSARQNYVVARIGKPAYVNVFMGRLNSFVADNQLGDGAYVGERATLASQTALKRLRVAAQTQARQIGASFRNGRQVADLAGLDVMTMPPKVADEFLHLDPGDLDIADRTRADYRPRWGDDVDPKAVGLETLWDVPPALIACVDALEREDLDSFTPDDLMDFFAGHGCGDVLVKWDARQIARSRAEGKIPKLTNWREALAEKTIGLDALINLAGLNAFTADQEAMDNRVADVLAKR